MGRHCEYALARNDGTVNHASGGNEKNSNPVKNLFTVLDYSGPRPAMRGAGSLYTPPHFALAKLPLRQAVALGGWVRSTLTGALLKIRYLPIYSFTPQKAFTLAEGATHVETSAGKCAHAFTLAEVLITLGIIGIVAAMTLPSLLNKAEKLILKNQFKKTYSLLSQALLKSETEFGAKPNCYYSIDSSSSVGNLTRGYGNITECAIFRSIVLKNLKVIQTCQKNAYPNCIPKYKGFDTMVADKNPDMTPAEALNAISGLDSFSQNSILNQNPSYVLGDGSIIISYSDYFPMLFAIDINGKKGPNKWGYDLFGFLTASSPNSNLLLVAPTYSVEKGGMTTKQMLEKMHSK